MYFPKGPTCIAKWDMPLVFLKRAQLIVGLQREFHRIGGKQIDRCGKSISHSLILGQSAIRGGWLRQWALRIPNSKPVSIPPFFCAIAASLSCFRGIATALKYINGIYRGDGFADPDNR